MSDKEQMIIFQKNLLEMLRVSQKSQIDVANAIGVSQQTFNSWCRGVAYPRIGKIEKLADYFGVLKSDLIEDKVSSDVVPSSIVLSDRDRHLVDLYHQLNTEGKDKLDERAEELIRMDYTIQNDVKKGKLA